MIIDCDRCEVRAESTCRDCVVSVLLGPPAGIDLDRSEQAAIDALAAAGMVPRLRLIPIEKSA